VKNSMWYVDPRSGRATHVAPPSTVRTFSFPKAHPRWASRKKRPLSGANPLAGTSRWTHVVPPSVDSNKAPPLSNESSSVATKTWSAVGAPTPRTSRLVGDGLSEVHCARAAGAARTVTARTNAQ